MVSFWLARPTRALAGLWPRDHARGQVRRATPVRRPAERQPRRPSEPPAERAARKACAAHSANGQGFLWGSRPWWRRNSYAHVRISVTPLRNILAPDVCGETRDRRDDARDKQWQEHLTWMKAFGGHKRRKYGE